MTALNAGNSLRILRQRARDDHVADRSGRKSIRHARLHLGLDGPLRVELARVLHDWIGKSEASFLGKGTR